MKYKYIIWDWNGTLFDDVEISVDTMNIMLEKTGYKNRIDSELYKNIFKFKCILPKIEGAKILCDVKINNIIKLYSA